MQLDSMFISNCNITLHVSGRFLRPSSEALKNCSNSLWCMTLSHIVYTQYDSAEANDLGRPYWILHPVSCHTPESVTTVFKCSWGWTQKASETCRALLQLLINILPSCITLVLYIYIVYVIVFWRNKSFDFISEEMFCISWSIEQHFIRIILPVMFQLCWFFVTCSS